MSNKAIGNLVISCDPGDDVYVGDRRVVVGEVFSPKKFSIEVHGGGLIRKFMVEDRNPGIKILPNITIECAAGGDEYRARMMIRAPKTVNIVRGKVMRRNEKDNAAVH